MSAPHRARRLAILGSLYAAQGIVYGFGGYVLVPTLAAAGVSLTEQAGILALAGLPWIFKLLWAPILDRFGGLHSGRARGFASAGMLAIAVVLGILAVQPSLSAAPRSVALLWLLLNVALSLQDVATDALVLDLVPKEERGLTNGVLLGGHHVGAEGIGSLGLGLLVASQGMSAALWAQAGIMLLLAVLPRGLPVPPPEATPRRSQLGAALLALVRNPAALKVAALAAVVLAADVLTSAVTPQFWIVRLAWSVETLSTRIAPLLLVVYVVGYAIATALVDRFGHGRSAAVGSAALGVGWMLFGAVPDLWSSDAFVLAFVAVQVVAIAVLYVGLHAALMDATEPALRASHFAVLMALLNLPRAVVVPWAPDLVEWLDFPQLFVYCGIFQIAMARAIGWAGLTGRAR